MEKLTILYDRLSTAVETIDETEITDNRFDLIFFDNTSSKVPLFERKKGKKLKDFVERGLVKKILLPNINRFGRNIKDVIETLIFFESKQVNIHISNLNIDTIINGQTNPFLLKISTVFNSFYEIELENTIERLNEGREKYLKKGGKFGRSLGSTEDDSTFINKQKNQNILNFLKENKYTIRQIAEMCETSLNTVVKVKKIAIKLFMLSKKNIETSYDVESLE